MAENWIQGMNRCTGPAPRNDRRCDNCANRGPWRAEYSKVPIGPQGVAVADCPHAYPGTSVTPLSGSHCNQFSPRPAGVNTVDGGKSNG